MLVSSHERVWFPIGSLINPWQEVEELRHAMAAAEERHRRKRRQRLGPLRRQRARFLPYENSHRFLKQGHLKPWPEPRAVEAAVAAAIQRERMRFSARLASVPRNIGLSSGSLNPNNPVHLHHPTASAPGICGSTALPAVASAFSPSLKIDSEQK